MGEWRSCRVRQCGCPEALWSSAGEGTDLMGAIEMWTRPELILRISGSCLFGFLCTVLNEDREEPLAAVTTRDSSSAR